MDEKYGNRRNYHEVEIAEMLEHEHAQDTGVKIILTVLVLLMVVVVILAALPTPL